MVTAIDCWSARVLGLSVTAAWAVETTHSAAATAAWSLFRFMFLSLSLLATGL